MRDTDPPNGPCNHNTHEIKIRRTVELTARLNRLEAVLVADPAATQPAFEDVVDAPQPIAV